MKGLTPAPSRLAGADHRAVRHDGRFHSPEPSETPTSGQPNPRKPAPAATCEAMQGSEKLPLQPRPRIKNSQGLRPQAALFQRADNCIARYAIFLSGTAHADNHRLQHPSSSSELTRIATSMPAACLHWPVHAETNVRQMSKLVTTCASLQRRPCATHGHLASHRHWQLHCMRPCRSSQSIS